MVGDRIESESEDDEFYQQRFTNVIPTPPVKRYGKCLHNLLLLSDYCMKVKKDNKNAHRRIMTTFLTSNRINIQPDQNNGLIH
jgi:hypothetical protein